MSSVQDDKRATKPKDAVITTYISKHLGDEENTLISNTKDKKKMKISEEKTEIKKLSSNEVINEKQQNTGDDFDSVHTKIYKCEVCEKLCKTYFSLNKHKAKAHVSNGDVDFTMTNISKCSVDEVYTSLLNTPEKKIKKRKIASKEKTQVDNEVISHKWKIICDDISTKHCEKSCKSNSSLDKHKAKAHLLKKDADYITTNILKRSVDEVYTSLLINTPEKEMKARKKALLLNTQVKEVKKNNTKVKMETVTVIEKKICDEPKENSDTNESQIGKFYKCGICKKLFEFLSALDEHQTNCHVTYVNPCVCTFCSKTFENANSLSAHKCIGTGKSSLECCICNKTYSTRSVLFNHYKVHTGESPHVCDVCSKPFKQKGNLTKHYRTHTGERPYLCYICGKAFAQNGHLVVHYRTHTGERPYACNVCGKTFVQKGILTVHYKIHTGERPYTCDICGKTFVVLFSLTNHYRIHTGEKPYQCVLCEMSFTDSSNRNRHMRLKHDTCCF